MSSSHWLDKAADLLVAPTDNLRDLAVLAGGDPRTFYRHTSLDGCDLRGQDLSGMEFTTLGQGHILVDESTKFDPQYQRDFERLLALSKGHA